MSTGNRQQDHWPVVWIRPGEQLPDTCVSCGMFTDIRTRATLLESQTRMVDAGTSSDAVALGCLLHLLGPIGWIIAALLMHGQKDKKQVAKTTTKKQSIRVPQCRLCRGVETIEPRQRRANGAFAFQVHPKFEQRLAENRAVDDGPG